MERRARSKSMIRDRPCRLQKLIKNRSQERKTSGTVIELRSYFCLEETAKETTWKHEYMA